MGVLPRRVQSVAISRGDIVSGPIMVVSGAEVTISSSVSTADRLLLTEGQTATADDEASGLEFEVEIVEIATSTGGRAAEGRYAMTLRPTQGLSADVAGLNLRITIPISSTDGEVLTVPLAALSAGADGSVRVEVEISPGVTRSVPVATGLQTTGFVEVDPSDETLEQGEQVVVGRS